MESTSDEKNEKSAGIWMDNMCIVCNKQCHDTDDRENHEKLPIHKKKVKLYEFYNYELDKFERGSNSHLFLRYKQRRMTVVGLETIHELHCSWTTTIWTCSICFEVGLNYAEADVHLTSLKHLKMYASEYYPEMIEPEWENLDDEEAKVKYDEFAAKIYEKNGTGVPEVLRMTWARADCAKHLGVNISDKTFKIEVKDSKKMAFCKTCRDTVAVMPSNRILEVKALRAHREAMIHQKCEYVKVMLDQFMEENEVKEVVDKKKGDLEWLGSESDNENYLNMEVGLNYCLESGDEKICMICQCVADGNHFASEFHLVNYLAEISVTEMFFIKQQPSSRRKKNLLEHTKGVDMKRNAKFTVEVKFPQNLKAALNPDNHAYGDIMPEVSESMDGSRMMLCPICWEALMIGENCEQVDIENSWARHIRDPKHMEMILKRSLYNFDERFFVPLDPHIKQCLSMKKEDEVIEEKGERIQNQCLVGMEFMVLDQDNNEAVCTLCSEMIPMFSEVPVKNHLKSLKHLKRYLCVTNSSFATMFMTQKVKTVEEELILDWLQRNASQMRQPMKVFSKSAMTWLNEWDLGDYDEIHNAKYRLEAAEQGSSIKVTAREALLMTNCLIINDNGEPVVSDGEYMGRCLECDLVFTMTKSNWCQKMAEHFRDPEHARRIQVLMDNRFEVCGLLSKPSTYTVKESDAINDDSFVKNVCGLENLLDRRYGVGDEIVTDFYCQCCAEVIKKRWTLLKEHVLGESHVRNFIHQKMPGKVAQMEKLEGDERKKFMAEVVKDVKPEAEYCISVYDPYGVALEKTEMAEKAKMEEEMKLEEMRKGELKRKKMEDLVKQQEELKRIKLEVALERAQQKQTEDEKRQRLIETLKTNDLKSRDMLGLLKRPSISERTVDRVLTDGTIRSKALLISYLKRGGSETIPPSEKPMEVVTQAHVKSSALGLQCVFEVVCADDPAYDSYFCTLCATLMSAPKLYEHLDTEEHQIAYFYLKHPNFYKSVMEEKVPSRRTVVINHIVASLCQKQGKSGIEKRLVKIVDRNVYEKAWPRYEAYFNGTEPEEVPEPVGMEALMAQANRRCEALIAERKKAPGSSFTPSPSLQTPQMSLYQKTAESTLSSLRNPSQEVTSRNGNKDEDEKAKQRKLLGVIITMQQESERTGTAVNRGEVAKIYQEMGLNISEGDKLLRKMLQEQKKESARKTVDLEAFGITFEKKNSAFTPNFSEKTTSFTPNFNEPQPVPPPQAVPRSSFGIPESVTQSVSRSSFGIPDTVTQSAPRSSFGIPEAATHSASQANFGHTQTITPSDPQTNLAQPQTVSRSTPQANFGQAQTVTQPAPQMNFGQPQTVTPSVPQSNFGQPQAVPQPVPPANFSQPPPVAQPSYTQPPPVAHPTFNQPPPVSHQAFGQPPAVAPPYMPPFQPPPVPPPSFGAQPMPPFVPPFMPPPVVPSQMSGTPYKPNQNVDRIISEFEAQQKKNKMSVYERATEGLSSGKSGGPDKKKMKKSEGQASGTDEDESDDEYKEIMSVLRKLPSKKSDEDDASDKLPGQKLALPRTVLPNGEKTASTPVNSVASPYYGQQPAGFTQPPSYMPTSTYMPYYQGMPPQQHQPPR